MAKSDPQPRGFEHLPVALLATIMTKLDVPSICSLACTCRTFKACASQLLSFLPSFHLLDISPSIGLLRPLLPPNPCLRTLKLNCSRLDDSAIDFFIRPSLHEISLLNCADLGGRLLFEIGTRCKHLRSLYLSSLAEKRGRSIHVSDLEELLSGCSDLEDQRTGRMIGTGLEYHSLYYMSLAASSVACTATTSPLQVYYRLGHPSLPNLKKMVPSL